MSAINQPSQTKLNIVSLSDLEHRLGESRTSIRKLMAGVENQYKPFELNRPSKPFQRKAIEPKQRLIDNPLRRLKEVQRKILERLLHTIEPSDFQYGGVKDRSISKHATVHLGASTLVKMDVSKFFPSVTNNHIYRVWNQTLGCSPPVSRVLTRLTTVRRHLPQGAPTSCALANLFLQSLYEPQILEICYLLDVTPSTWIDDLTFSGSLSRLMIEPVRKVLSLNGIKLSSAKTQISSPRSRKEVTGTRLGTSEIRVTRKYVSDVRAGIHKLELNLIAERDVDLYVHRLLGKIVFMRSVCAKDSRAAAFRLKVACAGKSDSLVCLVDSSRLKMMAVER